MTCGTAGRRRIQPQGSLSIKALNDDYCSRSVDGLVCMATPFLALTRYRLRLVAPSLQSLFDFAAVYPMAICRIPFKLSLLCSFIWYC